jgi:hypothetical protein
MATQSTSLNNITKSDAIKTSVPISSAPNIASLLSPSIINVAQNQLSVSQVTNKITTTTLSKAQELQSKIEKLAKQKVNVEKDYAFKSQQLQIDYKAKKITQEEEQQKYNQFQKQKVNELKVINDEIAKLRSEITNSVKDPLAKAKIERKKIDTLINKNIKSAQKGYTKSNISRNLQLLKNKKKDIGAIILGRITNTLINAVSNNTRLQELVDTTNDFIISADTPEKIQQAIILRNNAIQIINSQYEKFQIIKTLIEILKIVLLISEITIIILTIIFSIPPPAGLGPVMPPPIKKLIDKLKELVKILYLAIPIMSNILEQNLAELEDLLNQLYDINSLLDIKASSLDSTELNKVTNNTIKIGTYPEVYKGFKFAIKEESGPKAVVVAGNKRHYAVAINDSNVEVIKSELSFTLDPNDLISQLKLVINQQGLTTGDGLSSVNTPSNATRPNINDIDKANIQQQYSELQQLINQAEQ